MPRDCGFPTSPALRSSPGQLQPPSIVGPSWSLWQNLVVFVAILFLGTGAFAAGWLGGGDVKLLAAAGLWLDLRAAIGSWPVFMAGGLVAICLTLWPAVSAQGNRQEERRIPYGIAIAVGALAMILISRQAPSARERAFSTLTAAHRVDDQQLVANSRWMPRVDSNHD